MRIPRIMSYRDYLHEKAEESRHNETVAYLMFLAGTTFFVGGILENLLISSVIERNPDWFLFIPYYTVFHSGTILGLALIICGLTLIVYGITAGISYSRDRSWYMNELRKANSMEEVLLSKKMVTSETKGKKARKTAKHG
ncbi:MAG: hypothetical protein QXU45_07725 [Candidatus Bathyarchaeia archaeon]